MVETMSPSRVNSFSIFNSEKEEKTEEKNFCVFRFSLSSMIRSWS